MGNGLDVRRGPVLDVRRGPVLDVISLDPRAVYLCWAQYLLVDLILI